MNGIIRQNQACLDQARDLLNQLSPEAYTEKETLAFNSTIGDHIRHMLDHYLALRKGLSSGCIDYESRDRDPEIGSDPEAARRAVDSMLEFLETLGNQDDMAVKVVSDNGEDPLTQSTLSRELNFLLSHTVHHFALIAMICGSRKQSLPEGFGVAPSTLRYQTAQSQSCAR